MNARIRLPYTRRAAAAALVAALDGCAAAQPPQPPGLFIGLRAVVYPAAQAGAGAWYASLLGAVPLPPILGGTGFAVGLAQLDLDAAAPTPLALWEVADIDEAFQRLLAQGAEAVTGIQEIGAVHVAVFRDPFGNLLGITDVPATSP